MEIQVKKNKTLCLRNVLSYTLDVRQNDAFDNVAFYINKMLDYIKVCGTSSVGPVIQYNDYTELEDGRREMKVQLLVQCKDFICHVEKPYEINSKLQIKNCYYCHYEGVDNGLQYAYMKTQVEAFEDGAKLKKDNYTIFLNNDEEKETIIADVFMPILR